MADDMEKNRTPVNEQTGQSGQHGSQSQRQDEGQSGQTGQKKGGPGTEDEEESLNRQRRAS